MKSIRTILSVLFLNSGVCSGRFLAEGTAVPAASLVRRAPWQPAVGSSWQIILSQKLSIDAGKPTVTPDVEVFDIDMFAHQGTSTVASLHKLNKKVICYFSAGSYEPYRPDSSLFTPSVKGLVLDGWPDEYWIDIRSSTVRKIMVDRISIAAQMGCDAIDPDNVDGYQNKNGLGLTAQNSVDFIKFLAAEAAKQNMAIGLKNALSIIPDVLPYVQFAVNEQCARYEECNLIQPFIAAGKPVFHIEYIDGGNSRRSLSSRLSKRANIRAPAPRPILPSSLNPAIPTARTTTKSGTSTTTTSTRRPTTTKTALATPSVSKANGGSGTAPSVNPGTSGDSNTACTAFRNTQGFSTVIKKLVLDGWIKFCNGQIATTSTQS